MREPQGDPEGVLYEAPGGSWVRLRPPSWRERLERRGLRWTEAEGRRRRDYLGERRFDLTHCVRGYRLPLRGPAGGEEWVQSGVPCGAEVERLLDQLPPPLAAWLEACLRAVNRGELTQRRADAEAPARAEVAAHEPEAEVEEESGPRRREGREFRSQAQWRRLREAAAVETEERRPAPPAELAATKETRRRRSAPETSAAEAPEARAEEPPTARRRAAQLSVPEPPVTRLRTRDRAERRRRAEWAR